MIREEAQPLHRVFMGPLADWARSLNGGSVSTEKLAELVRLCTTIVRPKIRGGNPNVVGQPMLIWNSGTKGWHVLGEDGARFELVLSECAPEQSTQTKARMVAE